MSELNQLWADGRPLADLFGEVLSNTPVDAEAESKLPPRDTPVDPKHWGALGYAMAWLRLDQDRRERALDDLRRQFVRGKWRAIGRYWIDENRAALMEITDWLGARLAPEVGEVVSNGVKYDKVHVVAELSTLEPTRLAVDQADALSATTPQKPDLLKMKKEEIRQLAIDACANPNQVEWWHKGKDDRRAGYVDWLRNDHEFKTSGAYGYGADSWEASENKYKRARGLLKT